MSQGTVTIYEGDELPRCQIPLVHPGELAPHARYDGKTRRGPWAYMCPSCFKVFGVGLGVGRGQRLVLPPEQEQEKGT